MTTLKSLKNLVAVIVGGISPANIPGTTIPEVIDYLAENYPGGGSIPVDDLTVTTVGGTAIGTTKVTVKPSLTSGNKYLYKISSGTIDTPEYNEIISDGTAWDGVSDIEGEDGYKIGIYEVDSENKAVKFGVGIINTNLG